MDVAHTSQRWSERLRDRTGETAAFYATSPFKEDLMTSHRIISRALPICVALSFLLPVAAVRAQQATEAASTTAANNLAPVDKAFVQAASMANSTEIDASKLAMDKSFDNDVKLFARRMVADHSKLMIQLKIAAPHDVTVPKDNSDVALMNALKGLQGHAFDKVYVQKIGIEGHRQAVQAFEAEASSGQNADLKKAAQKALPTIRLHYQMAQQLAKKIGVGAS